MQLAMAGGIGGTAEALGGGKFANGAVTGAYVMMFNHMGGRLRRGNNIPEYEKLPPDFNSKNFEYASVDGTDYLFFDNQWLELAPEDYIYYGKDPDPLGIEDIRVVIPRESMAIYNHLKTKEMTWGLAGAFGVKGMEATVKTFYNLLLKGKISVSPMGYLLGGTASYIHTFNRMREHDIKVDQLRNH